jgi:subtilisin family serine protease
LLRDLDNDGRISFWDLNDTRNQGAGKIVDGNGNGYIDGGDLLRTKAQGGWADGASNDGDTFVDDLIGWDFVNNDNNPLDDNDHGSHVAGIIGATPNDAQGVAGINWRVSMMAIKTIGADGSGATSNAIAGLNYAVAKGAAVSNNSYGGLAFNQALYDAINNARARGHIFVTSAGNEAENLDVTPLYPASYDLPNVVAVAATTRTDARAGFTNYGATNVDLGAPGREILSTGLNNGYRTYSGTSMAAPHVTGVIALIRGRASASRSTRPSTRPCSR